MRVRSAGDHPDEDAHPDQDDRPLAGSEPLWSGASDALQLRLSHPVNGLRAHFVRVSPPDTPTQRLREGLRGMRARLEAAQAATQHPGAPPIIPRSAWADPGCRPRAAPAYGAVQVAFVHHTESTNAYGANESAAMIRAICRFHQDVRGWNDIGYNFLVDRFGRIFEGRAGGIDAAVIGAHAGGFNAQSTGVSVLGSFTTQPAPGVALEALERLLAWKLTLHGATARGQTSLRSAGGSATEHRRGTFVALARIAGHRDADSTACPGRALYAQLPAMRSAVAARAAPFAVLVARLARAALTIGQSASLSGRLTLPDGTPASDAPLAIQLLQGAVYATIAYARTDADGHWALELPITAIGVVRVLWSGSDKAGATASNALAIDVSPALDARLSTSTVSPGSRVSLSGSIRPPKARLELRVERRVGGRWRSEVRRRLTVRDGRFSTAPRLVRAGRYRLRVRFGGDRLHAPAEVLLHVAAAARSR